MLTLRPMSEDELPSVADWLQQVHVARWWTSTITAEEVLALYQLRVNGLDPRTNMLMCSDGGEDFGWCQWYLWVDYEGEALARDAREGEIGIDYAIGLPSNTGRGLGTRLVATLVEHVKRMHPRAGILADPEEANEPSRRVLEKNGFSLIEARRTVTEVVSPRRALYRLSPASLPNSDEPSRSPRMAQPRVARTSAP